MLVVGEHAGKHISDFSGQFQAEFVTLLSRRFGTNRVKANNVYQEYIQDRHHLHMNSTRWMSLSEFVKHLGREGIVRVDETEKGFFISWVDNSPKAMAKAEATQKKERAVTSDEQRERMLIAEQIARAAEASTCASSASTSSTPPLPGASESAAAAPVTGLLQREDGAAPVRLSFGKKASPPAAEPSEAGPSNAEASSSSVAAAPTPALKMNAFKKATPAPVNPLKKTNVFKSAKAAAPSSSSAGDDAGASGTKRARDEMPAAQRLILEEQERKRRRVGAA